MKKFLLLWLSFLCLGSLFPLMSYQLCNVLSANGNSTSASSSQTNQSLSSLWETAPDAAAQSDASTSNENSAPTTLDDPSDSTTDTTDTTLAPLLILDEGSGEVISVSVREYLIGAVASELAMTWPDQALQAQAIACHSYILYCKDHADLDALGGAYLSADPARRQGFMTDTVLRSYWGDDYDANYTRLSALVDEVIDIVVLYDGAAAATSYFAISNTLTETSEAVWGEALPYLISVDSSADANADGYLSQVSYTQTQVEEIITTTLWLSCDGVTPEDYFTNYRYTSAGYVAQIAVCGYDISGSALRTAFSLRSSCFSITYNATDGSFTFTTAGYGHGVGLSQWGAKFRAEAGDTYAQILAHYFPNTTLGSASSL